MSTQILIKRSTTSGAIPTTSDIDTGELAINTADKRIFTNASGTIVELGTTPTAVDVTGNATVGGTFDVTGLVSVDDFTATGTVNLTGATTTVAAPTADSHAATKLYVDTEVNAILDGAPAALDTLNEIAAAINDDASVYTTLTNSIATKLPLAGGTMTGNIDLGSNKVTTSADPTADNDLARKGYVDTILGSATAAATSATEAANSATNAATSASNAATSASTATTQASAASTSATNAASSATSASNSATASANSATASATSATNAATSETNAATSATEAATSAAEAAQSAQDAEDTLSTKVSKSGDTMTGDLDVTGTVTADGLTVDGDVSFRRSGSTGQYVSVSSNISGSTIRQDSNDSANKGLVLDAGYNSTGGSYLTLRTEETDRLKITSGGDISFYEDTGTTPKFFWDASAESLGIGTSSPSAPLHVKGGSGSTAFIVGNTVETTQLEITATGNDSINLDVTDGGNNRALTFSQSGSERMRIDSSGNVGIGTSSPSNLLHLKTEGYQLAIEDSSSGHKGEILVSDTSLYLFSDRSNSVANSDIRFSVDGSERMRIDSSGNLLVGKTGLDIGVAGHEFRSTGLVWHTVSGDEVMGLNRLSSDGEILQFRKDGSTVGSIGVAASDNIYLAGGTGGTKGIYLSDDGVVPATTGGAPSDNSVDLGVFNVRWKDLYLSGGVYLGGTGSANKLDDYEEGSFTPVLADATSGGNTASGDFNGHYTKVGNVVHVWIRLVDIDTTGMTAANDLFMQNLPFSASSNDTYGLGPAMCDRIVLDNYVVAQVFPGTTRVDFKSVNSNNHDDGVRVTDVSVSGGSDILVTLAYRTA